MLWFAIVSIVGILALIFKKVASRNKTKSQVAQSAPLIIRDSEIVASPSLSTLPRPQQEILINGNVGELCNIISIKQSFIELSVFEDHYDDYATDYSHLTPSEAKKELESLKDEIGYIDHADYCGLIDAIASGKDQKYFDRIETQTPEQTNRWFRQNLANDIHMSTAVWKAVGEIVATLHEDYLLKALDAVTIGKVEGWVRARKKEGYFFTQRVYDKAIDIRLGKIENRKSKKVHK